MVAAATALIAKHGSRALTLAAVGEAAGYSRGIVSHHFGSRENLLRAVVRDAQTFTLPDLGDSAADWLADTVRAYLKNVTSRRPAVGAFLQMWGEAIAADPVLMPLYAEQDASFRRLLADKVREGIRDGSVRADANPEAMSNSVPTRRLGPRTPSLRVALSSQPRIVAADPHRADASACRPRCLRARRLP